MYFGHVIKYKRNTMFYWKYLMKLVNCVSNTNKYINLFQIINFCTKTQTNIDKLMVCGIESNWVKSE